MPALPDIRTSDSEKITVNLGVVDLGRVDLLVREGFYSNRTDFIRTAIRNQLTAQGDAVTRSLERQVMDLGLRDLNRAELEQARERGERLNIRVVGLLRIAADVSADLAQETIATITVLGAMQAPANVKAVLKDRTI